MDKASRPRSAAENDCWQFSKSNQLRNAFSRIIASYSVAVRTIANAASNERIRSRSLENRLENRRARLIGAINICIQKLQGVNEIAQISLTKRFHQTHLRN